MYFYIKDLKVISSGLRECVVSHSYLQPLNHAMLPKSPWLLSTHHCMSTVHCLDFPCSPSHGVWWSPLCPQLHRNPHFVLFLCPMYLGDHGSLASLCPAYFISHKISYSIQGAAENKTVAFFLRVKVSRSKLWGESWDFMWPTFVPWDLNLTNPPAAQGFRKF